MAQDFKAINHKKLKTELIHEYSLEEGIEISRVLPIGQDNFLVLVYKEEKGRKKFCINIEGDHRQKIYVSPVKKGYDQNRYISLFKYKKGFGLMEYTGRVSLWKDLRGKPKKFIIKDPFFTENAYVKGFTSSISFENEEFIIGVEESFSSGFPAKYWTKLVLKPKSVLGIKIPLNSPVLGKLYELDLNAYPKTYSHQFPEGEWLNILSLMKKEDKIYLHTNGGRATRTKSGPDFEFSILSILDGENNLVRNINIEEGKGHFSTDKKYFILHPRKNKKKLLFYNLENFEIEFEVPFPIPEKYTSFDLYGENLYTYGKDFLHIRKLSR